MFTYLFLCGYTVADAGDKMVVDISLSSESILLLLPLLAVFSFVLVLVGPWMMGKMTAQFVDHGYMDPRSRMSRHRRHHPSPDRNAHRMRYQRDESPPDGYSSGYHANHHHHHHRSKPRGHEDQDQSQQYSPNYYNGMYPSANQRSDDRDQNMMSRQPQYLFSNWVQPVQPTPSPEFQDNDDSDSDDQEYDEESD